MSYWESLPQIIKWLVICLVVLVIIHRICDVYDKHLRYNLTALIITSGMNATQLDERMQNVLNININMPNMPNY
jgi:uncharacterized membrane protein YjfL (UPF0719 family)